MRNCNDALKRVAVPTTTANLNIEKYIASKNDSTKHAKDWFNEDYRSIILRNMGKEEENGVQN